MSNKKQSLPKRVKTECWDTWIGKDFAIAKCMCCEGVEIRNIEFDCGHVLAEANGGLPHAKNLRPICSSCNNSMGTEHMAIFKFKYGWGILKGFTEDQILKLINPIVNQQVPEPVVPEPVVPEPVVPEPVVPKIYDCLFWEKDLIKRVLPKIIQIPYERYTGIKLDISEKELFDQIEKDLKGLYELGGGNVYIRID